MLSLKVSSSIVYIQKELFQFFIESRIQLIGMSFADMSAITFYSLFFLPFIPKIMSPFSLTIHQSSLGFSNLAIVFQHRSISDDNFAFHGPTKRRKNISPTRFDCFSPQWNHERQKISLFYARQWFLWPESSKGNL